MDTFIQGSISTAFLAAGLFFLRYWRDTQDRLFMLFALAFGILALNRVLIAAWALSYEDHYSLYLLRLLAFLIIAAAIIDKNLQRPAAHEQDKSGH